MGRSKKGWGWSEGQWIGFVPVNCYRIYGSQQSKIRGQSAAPDLRLPTSELCRAGGQGSWPPAERPISQAAEKTPRFACECCIRSGTRQQVNARHLLPNARAVLPKCPKRSFAQPTGECTLCRCARLAFARFQRCRGDASRTRQDENTPIS